MKLFIFLLFVAAAIARPATQSNQETPVTVEKNETQVVINIIKEIKHLSDEDVDALKEKGIYMLKELEEKKTQLEAKTKQEYEDMIQLSQVLKENAEKEFEEYKNQAKEVKSKELPFNFNEECTTDEDCSEGTFCYPVAEALQTVLEAYGDIKEYELIAKKAHISGNECIQKFSKEALFFQVDSILVLFNEKKQKIEKLGCEMPLDHLTLQRL
jgi:hypothetical protein